MNSDDRREATRRVIREFSQVTTFSRTSWHEYAAELHPEITRACIPTLLTISHRQPISATDLVCVQNSDKTLISKQVGLLKQLGLVETEVSDEDRRVTLISVSDLGAERIAHVRELLVDRYLARFDEFSDDDIETLNTLLHRFNAGAADAVGGETQRPGSVSTLGG